MRRGEGFEVTGIGITDFAGTGGASVLGVGRGVLKSCLRSEQYQVTGYLRIWMPSGPNIGLEQSVPPTASEKERFGVLTFARIPNCIRRPDHSSFVVLNLYQPLRSPVN